MTPKCPRLATLKNMYNDTQAILNNTHDDVLTHIHDMPVEFPDVSKLMNDSFFFIGEEVELDCASLEFKTLDFDPLEGLSVQEPLVACAETLVPYNNEEVVVDESTFNADSIFAQGTNPSTQSSPKVVVETTPRLDVFDKSRSASPVYHVKKPRKAKRLSGKKRNGSSRRNRGFVHKTGDDEILQGLSNRFVLVRSPENDECVDVKMPLEPLKAHPSFINLTPQINPCTFIKLAMDPIPVIVKNETPQSAAIKPNPNVTILSNILIKTQDKVIAAPNIVNVTTPSSSVPEQFTCKMFAAKKLNFDLSDVSGQSDIMSLEKIVSILPKCKVALIKGDCANREQVVTDDVKIEAPAVTISKISRNGTEVMLLKDIRFTNGFKNEPPEDAPDEFAESSDEDIEITKNCHLCNTTNDNKPKRNRNRKQPCDWEISEGAGTCDVRVSSDDDYRKPKRYAFTNGTSRGKPKPDLIDKPTRANKTQQKVPEISKDTYDALRKLLETPEYKRLVQIQEYNDAKRLGIAEKLQEFEQLFKPYDSRNRPVFANKRNKRKSPRLAIENDSNHAANHHTLQLNRRSPLLNNTFSIDIALPFDPYTDGEDDRERRFYVDDDTSAQSFSDVCDHRSSTASTDTLFKDIVRKPKRRTYNKRREETKLKKRPSKGFSCDLCDKTFTTLKRLDRHALEHFSAESYRCRICDEYFTTFDDLDNHHRQVHVSHNLYDCAMCKTSFANKRTHLHKRSDFVCYLCNASFIHKTTLKSHIESHVGERLYDCTACPKKFIKLEELNDHLTLHMLNPFRCEKCHDLFSNRNAIHRHLTRHIRIDGKDMSCGICGQGFVLRCRIKAHMKQHVKDLMYNF